MSKSEDFEILRKIIDASKGPISTKELLETPKEFFEIGDLINYWSQRLLYANQIQHTEKGYIPGPDCSWSLSPQTGYYGFAPEFGAYQINENTPNPINATLEGSIGLDSPIVSVAIHPDKQHFALGTRNGMIAICNLNQVRTIKMLRGSESRTWALAYSPSGEFLLSGHQNGDLLKWADDDLIQKVRTEDWVRSISFSPKGEKFLTSHRVKNNEHPSIYEWDINSFQSLGSFMHVPETTWCVKYLIDGTGFVSTGSDMKVTLWSFGSNKVLWSGEKHTGTVIVLAMHPFGGVVASGAWTGSLKIWDLENGTDIITIEAHPNRVYGLVFSPSGNILASGSKDSEICLWKMPAGNITARFTGHLGWVRGLAFFDETTLISIGTDGFCKIWRLSYSFPRTNSALIYHSSQEVLNDYRRFMVHDDE